MPRTKEAKKLTCDCADCLSGKSVPMEEWLKNPKHQHIWNQVAAGLDTGRIKVQGETHETTPGVEPLIKDKDNSNQG